MAPAGYRLEVVVDAPTILHPRGLCFSPEGDLFLLDDQGVKKLCVDAAAGKLTGQAELLFPAEAASAFVVGEGWIVTAEGGALLRRRIDPPAARAEKLVTGLLPSSRHGSSPVRSLAIGPDGWLYFSLEAGEHRPIGSDGTRAGILRGAGVLRCRPDGARLETFAQGYGHPWRGFLFDEHLRPWHVALEPMPNGGWMPQLGLVEDDALFGFGSARRPMSAPLLRQHDADCLALLGGAALPPSAAGRFLGGPGGADGTLALLSPGRCEKPDPLLQESAAGRLDQPLFRPVAVAVGPDQAVYLADRQFVMSKTEGPFGTHGRILRLSWSGAAGAPGQRLNSMNRWRTLRTADDEGLLAGLRSAIVGERLAAASEAARRGDLLHGRLLAIATDRQEPLAARLHALAASQQRWNPAVRATCLALLAADEPDVARLAAEWLGRNAERGDQTAETELIKRLTHSDAEAARAAALALGRIGGAAAADALVNMVKFDEGKDPAQREGWVRGLERLAELGLARLASLAESDRDQDRQNAVAAFALLGSQPAYDLIPRLLRNPHLDEEQAATLLGVFRNRRLEPPASAEPALAWLCEHPNAASVCKLEGLETLVALAGLDSPRAHELLLRLLKDDPDVNVRLAALEAARRVKLKSAAPLLLAQLTDRGRPAAEQRAQIAALGELKAKEALPLLKALAAAPEAEGLHEQSWRAIQQLAEPTEASVLALEQLPKAPPRLQPTLVLIAGGTPTGAKQAALLFLEGQLDSGVRSYLEVVLRRQAAKPEAQSELGALLEQVRNKK